MSTLTFLQRNLRWLAAGFTLCFASSFGQTYFIALFGAQYRDAFGLSDGAFGGLYTLATLASGAAILWLGKTADRFPPHRLGPAVVCGLALSALAVALAPNVLVLGLAFFGLRLFGQGMCSHVAMTAIARWYDAQRGRAVSIAALGFPVGEALYPALAVALALMIGWRETWVAAAVFLLVVIAPAAFALARRPPPESSAEAGTATPRRAARESWTCAQVLRDPLFYALLVGLLAAPMAITGVLFHQARLVETKGWSMALFAAGYPAYAAGAIGASLALGWLIDRFGARRMLPVIAPVLALGCATLAWGEAEAAIFIGMALMGAAGGASMAMAGAIYAELYGLDHLGAIRSVTVAGMVFSTAAAPGLMGALMDAGVAIETLVLMLAGYGAAAAIGLIPVSRILCARHD